MPFTISHVAAVLPLQHRAGLVTLPLVAGSMAPDLAMVVDLPGLYGLTHSLLGIVTVDLAITAGLSALWIWWVGEPVLAMSPAPLRRRLPPRPVVPSFRPMSVMWWLASAAVGAATHVFLDLFTHEDRARNIWPVLEHRIGRWPVAQWAQYVLGLLGLVLLVLYAVRWARRTAPRPQPVAEPPRAWPLVASLLAAGSVILATVARAVEQVDGYARGLRFFYQYTLLAAQMAFGFLAGMLLAAVLLGVAWRLLQRRRKPPMGRLGEQDEPHPVQVA